MLENGEPNPAIPWMSTSQSVASYLTAAYDPSVKGKRQMSVWSRKGGRQANIRKDSNGKCITYAAVDDSTMDYALDLVEAEKLWKLSEKLVGQDFSY